MQTSRSWVIRAFIVAAMSAPAACSESASSAPADGGAAACRETLDCPAGRYCGPAGACVRDCLVGDDCRAGERCDLRGRCVAGDAGAPAQDAGVTPADAAPPMDAEAPEGELGAGGGGACDQTGPRIPAMPIAAGTCATIVQGACGSFSHQGIYGVDLVVPSGTRLVAPASGRVVGVRNSVPDSCHYASYTTRGQLRADGACPNSPTDYGNYVAIAPSDPSLPSVVVAHLRYGGAAVRVDDVVVAGQEIGSSGNTGFSTNPHIHFACVMSGREQGTFQSAPCDFTWGAAGTGIRMSGRPSTGTEVCGIRPVQECAGADTEACGNCGTRTRSCNTESGQWTAWGACTGEGACAPGQTRACAGASAVTCTGACAWPACAACVAGATESQRCGSCGTQTRTCAGSGWSAWGPCGGEGACAPGQTRTCAGASAVACTSTCAWPACGACVNGATESQACGNCGTQTRTCAGGAWPAWGACGGEGACSPGQTRACAAASPVACTSSCGWPACGACVNGTTESQACGNCGRQTRTCGGGAWSSWGACAGSGECGAGQTRSCAGASPVSCSSSCAWPACPDCSRSPTLQSPSNGASVSAGAATTFRWSGEAACLWEVKARWCCVSGNCDVSAGDRDASCPEVFHLHNVSGTSTRVTLPSRTGSFRWVALPEGRDSLAPMFFVNTAR